MNPKIFFIFLLQSPSGDRWLAPDKLKHFMAAAFVESVAYGALRTAGVRHGEALGGAIGVTVTVGIGRELHDRRSSGAFSLKDLAWDLAGAAAAIPLLAKTER